MIDIHTHRRHGDDTYPGSEISSGVERDAIVSLEPMELAGIPQSDGRLYSVGFHPWRLPSAGPSAKEWSLFEEMAARKDVVAVGECGIDLLKGPLPAIQMEVFRRQAETAERLGKPLIIHCVKGYEQLIGLRKSLKPSVNWAIHGFRGKATVAKMMVSAGFWLSVGDKFNPSALAEIPVDKLLVETDESQTPLDMTVGRIAETLGKESGELITVLEMNAARFLGRDGIVAGTAPGMTTGDTAQSEP